MGIYFTTRVGRARVYASPIIFKAEVDDKNMLRTRTGYPCRHTPDNPTKEERLYRDLVCYEDQGGPYMKTINLPWEERKKASREIAEALLEHGYTGVIAGSGRDEREVVIFDPSVLRRVEMCEVHKSKIQGCEVIR